MQEIRFKASSEKKDWTKPRFFEKSLMKFMAPNKQNLNSRNNLEFKS